MMSNKMTITIDYGQATPYFNNNKVQNENGSNKNSIR